MDRLQSLARSAGGDEVLAAVIKTEYYGKLVARLLKAVKVGTAGVVMTSTQQVDLSTPAGYRKRPRMVVLQGALTSMSKVVVG